MTTRGVIGGRFSHAANDGRDENTIVAKEKAVTIRWRVFTGITLCYFFTSTTSGASMLGGLVSAVTCTGWPTTWK